MTDVQTQEEISAWIDQYTAASDRVRDSAQASAIAAWLAFTGWYSTQQVQELATHLADVSEIARQSLAGMASLYVAHVVAAIRGTTVQVGPVELPPLRNGVDPVVVHSRPAETYRYNVSQGQSPQEAMAAAAQRGGLLTDTDQILAERAAQVEQMQELGVTRYRRVIRPELSKTGTCGLCVVASDRIYTVRNLMPIHDRCKCKTVPVDNDNDPGLNLNQDDLDAIYRDAGGTAGDRLKEVRYQVNEHGELGPVLSKHGTSFRGRGKVRKASKGAAPDVDGNRSPQQLRDTLAALERSARKFDSPGTQARIDDLERKLAVL